MTKQGACRSGNSDGWPMKILKLASSENTDPALILKKIQVCKDLMEYLLLSLGSREKIYITYGSVSAGRGKMITLSKKNIFCRFTVTKRFDFFNFSQLL